MLRFVFLSLIAVIAVHAQLIFDLDGRPRATTPLGLVEGVWKVSYEGRRYAAFEGIPYAKPPLGDLRFEEPEPVEPWLGVWNATRIYKCPQVSFDLLPEPEGNEDCLYLNVYVPFTEETPLDVVVHIHGGGFMAGYTQEYIGDKTVMDRDIILVSFNYRLGALGFLSTEDEVVPGNNGLKDQVEGLKWVQKNIASFGGNPNSVTITGFSAGGASVHFHYFSPLSRGLFHRGISTSGSALSPWAYTKNPLALTKKLARNVGCDFDSTREIVSCLKTRPASLLVDAARKNLHDYPPFPFCLFTPVVEKGSSKPFLSDHPYKLLHEGKVLDVPWITSYTSEEGLIVSLFIPETLVEINNKWSEIFPYVLNSDALVGKPEIANKIKDLYASDPSNKLNLEDLTRITTDFLVKYGAEKSVELQSRASNSIYLYKFSYEGENSVKHLLSQKPIKGTCHGDDLIYFFGGTMIKPLNEDDRKLKDICLDILYSYAHTGIPKLNDTPLKPLGKKFVYYHIKGPDEIVEETRTDDSLVRFSDSIELLGNIHRFDRKDEL